MPRLLIAVPLICAVLPVAAPFSVWAQPATGSVSGVVVNSATGKPLPRATVFLIGAQAQRSSSEAIFFGGGGLSGSMPVSVTARLQALTDSEGRFAFARVAPGAYTLSGTRAGFANIMDAVLQGSGGKVSVRVAPGETVNAVKLGLVPEAVISGRVTDDEGYPLSGVSVRLMHPVYANGQRQFQRIEAISSSTDDRGEYRIYSLLPGRYLVVATGGNNGSAFDRMFPAFYPSGIDPEKAALFDIKPGAQLSDINLVLQPARTPPIRGRVIDGTTNQPAAGAQVMFSPMGSAFNSASTTTALANAQGEWAVSDLRSGPRAIAARLSRGQDRLFARINVDVPPTGLDDVRLTLMPGAEVKGAVRLEAQPSGPQANASMRVVLQPEEYDAGTYSGQAAQDGGGFTIRNIQPARYYASVAPLPEWLYLKSVQLERREVIDSGFELAESGSYRIDVTLGGDGAELEGAVKDGEGNPCGGVTVLLAPADATLRKTERLFKTAVTTHDGKYALKGIRPGDYVLYSWPAVDPGIWFEPDFLPRYAAKGVAVSLAPNDRKTAGLKLIIVSEQAAP
jgi:protocatechuate 3,4-dioxygenase beta subunit